MALECQAGRRFAEQHRHLGVGGGPVVFQCQHVMSAAVENGSGDLRLSAHRIDGDDRSGQVELLQQQRNGSDFVGLFLGRLLPQHQSLAGRPGGHQVQGFAAFATVVHASRGLAVDCDQFRERRVTQFVNPGQEAGLEQLRIDRGEHVTESVMARDAARVRQEAAKERQVLLAPKRGFHEIIRSGDRGGQRQQQNFRQWIQHLGVLTRVIDAGEMTKDRRMKRIQHGGLRR